MKPEIKKRWVEALRSGKYKQGLGRLAGINGGVARYCCLGVLCEIATGDKVIKKEEVEHPAGDYAYGGSERNYLPSRVMEWADLPIRQGAHFQPSALIESCPTYGDGRCLTSLAELNDSGVPFEEIANLIEAEL